MDFKVEGPWNTEKYCRPPWLDDDCLNAVRRSYLWHCKYWVRRGLLTCYRYGQ